MVCLPTSYHKKAKPDDLLSVIVHTRLPFPLFVLGIKTQTRGKALNMMYRSNRVATNLTRFTARLSCAKVNAALLIQYIGKRDAHEAPCEIEP
jgi:hypothetical protein